MTTASGSEVDALRFELGNGVDVRLMPIEGAGEVAVIAAYDVGFWDDPAGRPQMAHLVEHLRITAASGDHPAGETWDRFQSLGGANGETLPQLTYYDFVMPSDELGSVLDWLADRLTAFAPTQADITREGPRAGSEATNVASTPQVFVHKFAVTAATQGWRHGRGHASLHDGLEATPIEDAVAFADRFYRPERMTVCIAGGFDAAETRRLLEQTLGSAPRGGEAADGGSIEDAAATMRMTWDLPVSAVLVGTPAPESDRDRLALSLALQMGVMQAMGAGNAMGAGPMALSSGIQWPIDRAPAMVVLPVERGGSVDDAAARVHKALDTLAEGGTPALLSQLPMAARQFAAPQKLDANVLAQQARMLAPRMRIDDTTARKRVLGQYALNEVVRMTLPGDEGELERVAQMSRDEWKQLLSVALAGDKRRTLFIEPRNDN